MRRLEDPRSLIARFFELPEELLLDLPKVTLIGDIQVLIENHRGLLLFRSDRITVKTARGPLTVDGANLRVGAVDREAVVLTGEIRSLYYGEDRA